MIYNQKEKKIIELARHPSKEDGKYMPFSNSATDKDKYKGSDSDNEGGCLSKRGGAACSINRGPKKSERV